MHAFRLYKAYTTWHPYFSIPSWGSVLPLLASCTPLQRVSPLNAVFAACLYQVLNFLPAVKLGSSPSMGTLFVFRPDPVQTSSSLQ